MNVLTLVTDPVKAPNSMLMLLAMLKREVALWLFLFTALKLRVLLISRWNRKLPPSVMTLLSPFRLFPTLKIFLATMSMLFPRLLVRLAVRRSRRCSELTLPRLHMKCPFPRRCRLLTT